MNNTNNQKKEYLMIGIIGCLLGILCFVLIYGVKILNFTYDAWLLSDGNDLKQHYVGWCHYRNSQWSFPIGLIDSLSVPFSMSVVYTDSIPLFAVIFKLFRNYLPVHFQYFGLFGILCYALQGSLSAILIRRFTNNIKVCAGGSLVFILSFPLIQRMFYHTALGAQWIIILALIIWFSVQFKNGAVKPAIIWGLMGILCIGIHSYFIFMCGIVLILSIIDEYVSTRNSGNNHQTQTNAGKEYKNNNGEAKRILVNGIISVLAFCLTGFISLYILGGFYGESSVSGYGFGTFNANLNAFINPLSYSTFLKEMPLFDYFQYEGFAYLGIGVIVVLAILFVVYIANRAGLISKFKFLEFMYVNNSIKNISTEDGNGTLKPGKTTFFVMIAGAFFSFLIAVFPNIDLFNIKLVHIPLPGFMYKILGICRTNGRFVWIAYYLILLMIMVYIIPRLDKSFYKMLVIMALILQLFDMSKEAKYKHEFFQENYHYKSVWEDFEKMHLTNGKNQFMFMYQNSDIMMDTGFYGYLNNLSMNDFYYARPIDDSIKLNIEEEKARILSGEVNPEYIYVFRSEDLTEDVAEILKKKTVEYYFDDYKVYVMK